jgi:hypothetical protein
MNRKEVLAQARESFGLVPRWLEEMPDGALQQYWETFTWLLKDTALPVRDKVLIAFGAASAIHCSY